MKKINQKGSITLYVLIACIFFVVILSLVYTNLVHKKQAQEESISQIGANYSKNLSSSGDSDSLSSLMAEMATLNSRVSTLESKKDCNCDLTSITQQINALKTEIATLKTANEDKSTKISQLTTELASVKNDVNTLTTELTSTKNEVNKLNTQLVIDTNTTCGEFYEKVFKGQKVYFSWGSPVPSYGGGIVINISGWKYVNVIVADDDSGKTCLYSINCNNPDALVVDSITVTELN